MNGCRKGVKYILFALICEEFLETNFFNHGRLIPTIFSKIRVVQRPSGCMAESALKLGGAPVVLKIVSQSA